MTKRFEIVNLIAIRLGVDSHNRRCPIPPEAILLNPIDCQLLDHPRLWGIPVFADSSVPTKKFRIKCGGSAESIEEELEIFLSEI